MKTSSIRIEGNILSAELFEKIDSTDYQGQSPPDFGFDRSVKVKDDIARSWADAKDQWNIFKRRIEHLPGSSSGTEETRKYLIIPLLENLGYTLAFQRIAEMVNGKTYAVSHRAENLDNFPLHIIGINDSLDKKRETGGPRMSPHALVQEYLNNTEHLFGLVTNGIFLRVLRDSGKLVRLSYLEFNLERMLEDDLYAEFSIMYRLIHASRMPKKQTETEECILENYHQNAIESGSRIRENLSRAVERSIKTIANGFLLHPGNENLRELVRSGELLPEQYFQYLLRFIYRILFLLVIEERDIVFSDTQNEAPENRERINRFRDIYFKHYSISRLRKLAEKIYFFEDKQDDLWTALKHTFAIVEQERIAAKLGLYPLGGDLFSDSSLGPLAITSLGNRNLLECIRNLCLFEDTNGKGIVRVNYAALNVEEFGSVYEGLLEFNGKFTISPAGISFEYVKSSERSSSGSHYTPEELVQPLIKHSLEYILEDKLKSSSTQEAKVKSLLNIKVCDVACGSGHILLSAARRIAIELARVRTGEEQPSPGPYRLAMRDVINHCIYGVDKNPLAVELCKVALWLEAYNPGMPLSFLDHKIKCGDSIVGLARKEELSNGISEAAFKKMPGDDPAIVKELSTRHKNEAKGNVNIFDSNEVPALLKTITLNFHQLDEMPENTLNDVKAKAEYYNVMKGPEWWNLKEAADLQVAQFFIPKTQTEVKNIATYADYVTLFKKDKSRVRHKIAKAMALASQKKFFHWFLEFPEVFESGGFDCILGNPPFLGGQKLSGTFGDTFLNYVKTAYAPAGSCDLVTYFFRRIFSLIKPQGYQALISTNTIAQGSAREGGLEVILKEGGSIIFAIRSMKWPGLAAVEVSLVAIYKGKRTGKVYLGSKATAYISSYLDDTQDIGKPFPLKANENKSFQGSIVLGKGFILEPYQALALIEKDPKNKDVLFPYLNGDDLNSDPEQKPSRWVINFFDWDEDYCRKNYPDCFEIVERLVKPERTRLDENGNFELRKPLPQKWWIYGEKRPALYKTISGMERVLVVAQVSKTVAFNFTENNKVLDAKLIVFVFKKYSQFIVMQSNFHFNWAWKYCTTMKTDLSYTPTAISETFPFPNDRDSSLEVIGEKYYCFRQELMRNLCLGLTKTYNLFHTQNLTSDNPQLLKAHLQISAEQAVKDIVTLRQLHKEMDEAVLKADGWEDINLSHDFYEVDYLPENDRVRYTISPAARKEVLRRLLELNHKIHTEEVAAGLWDKKKAGKKEKPVKPNDNSSEYVQEGLF